MLLDPVIISNGQTISSTGGVASNFRRTAFGKYVCVDGAFTTDQPARLTLVPNVKLNGPSSYRFRYETDKNVTPVNGVQQTDDVLRVDLNLSGNLRSFGITEYVNAIASLTFFVLQNWSRLISGET